MQCSNFDRLYLNESRFCSLLQHPTGKNMLCLHTWVREALRFATANPIWKNEYSINNWNCSCQRINKVCFSRFRLWCTTPNVKRSSIILFPTNIYNYHRRCITSSGIFSLKLKRSWHLHSNQDLFPALRIGSRLTWTGCTLKTLWSFINRI